MKRFFIYILLLLAVLPVMGKKKDKNVKVQTPTVVRTPLSEDDALRYQYLYLEAVRMNDMGKYAEAYELFRHCLDIDKEAPETYFALARFESAFGRDSIARDYYTRAVDLDPKNDEFAQTLGQYLLSKDEIQEAAKVFENLLTICPDRSDIVDMLARIYEHEKDYSKELDALSRLETLEGQSEELTLSKMQVYSFMGDEKGAHRELLGLVKSHPNDLKYKVMMGNWLLSNGKKPEALNTFLEVLKEEPDNAQAQTSLMDYYRTEGNNEEADKLLYAMLENPKTEAATRITLMRQVVTDNEKAGGDSTRVLNIFNRVLSMPQKTSEMAEMKVAYLYMKGMPSDSIRVAIDKVLEINPEHVQARLQRLDMMWRDTVDQKCIDECQKAIEYSPEEPSLYYYLGLAKYLNKDDVGALEALRHGAWYINEETPDNVAGNIFMIMGDILHSMGHSQEAFAAYDSCLVYNPDEISCLNNYAYYLSVENKDLKRAEQMSYRTIKAEPQNSTYLDTYAWILYMQERYEEAKIYIDQVLKIDSADISDVILDHAGDIYFKIGRKTEAIEFWNKALEKDSESAEEIKRKIKNAR